jgi:hypothetical protein
MTFAVKAVREYDRGTTKDGRDWVKYLVITQDGEVLGSFSPEWTMFVGAQVTVSIKEAVVNGKRYKSVGRPPASVPQGAIARTTRMSPPPAPSRATQVPLVAGETQEMKGRIARIEAGLEQLLKRVDDVAAAQGDIAESTRTITGLLQRRQPSPPPDGASEEPGPDLEDPDPSELFEPDDEPAEAEPTPAEGLDGD